MKAQIITIGDEILIGQIVDSNSSWLASELTKLGFSISSILSISDSAKSISEALTQATKNNNLVILTGGLGPTKDDITKHTLCNYFNTTLDFNSTVFSDVEAFLELRGAKMNALNRDQALFPKNAQVLRNRQGTAPGIWFEQNSKIVISLPGVPWEMKGIFNDEIAVKLSDYFTLPENYYQTVMISGIGESPLAIKLEDWEKSLPDTVKLAYLPSPGLIRLRLGIIGKPKLESEKIIAAEINKLHKIIPEYIVSNIELSLQEIVVKHLNTSNKTISTAESCTGGTIAQMLTSIAGSSAIFKGSIVAYSNEIKSNILGINTETIEQNGAVSQSVVELMAQNARKLLNTDYAIATSGIAGPGGGTKDKPVGLVWIAVAGPNGVKSKKYTFGKERDINIKRSANAALNMFRENFSSNSI